MKLSRQVYIIILTTSFLLIPIVAMQYTDDVEWTSRDFAIMAILLIAVGLSLDFAYRKAKTRLVRVLALMGIFLMFVIIWAELAVGIFGTPFAGS